MKAMLQLPTWLQHRGRDDDERGAALVEYALLVALIAIVCLLAVVFLGEEASKSFTDTGNSVSAAN